MIALTQAYLTWSENRSGSDPASFAVKLYLSSYQGQIYAFHADVGDCIHACIAKVDLNIESADLFLFCS